MTKDEVKLAPIGLRVRIADTLIREMKVTPRYLKTWATWHNVMRSEPKPRTGFLTGYVYLRNGEPFFNGPDFSFGLDNAETIFAARVKFAPHGREYYARPEDIEIRELPNTGHNFCNYARTYWCDQARFWRRACERLERAERREARKPAIKQETANVGNKD